MTAVRLAAPNPAPVPEGPRWLVPWLLVLALSVMAMIALGGVVRLAEAGLSITEWAPVRGVVPPLSLDDWVEAFAAYRDSPEYRFVHAGMSMQAFRGIYWLEWIHRLVGRLVGLLVVVPLAVGLARRRFAPGLRRSLLGIAGLFAAQGVMGWLMVASGLVRQPWVSPYRLALHLWLALALLAWILWLLLDRTAGVAAGAGVLRVPATVALAVVVLQIGLGALMAGHRAGWMSDTFPRMGGRWFPAGLGEGGLSAVVADPLTVHFAHRWFAFVALAAVLWLHARARVGAVPVLAARLTVAATALALAQVGLGIAVVLAGVAAPLASMHQALGVLLFGAVVAVLHQGHSP